MCDVDSGLRIRATNYTVRDASVSDEEEEKLRTAAIERLQWPELGGGWGVWGGEGGLGWGGAWPLLLKCGFGSIRVIIRVVRVN